jgi:hypothetical protein
MRCVGCAHSASAMMLIRPDSRRLPTNQGEINARQSIAGTSLSWALSTSAELHTCVPKLGSKTCPRVILQTWQFWAHNFDSGKRSTASVVLTFSTPFTQSSTAMLSGRLTQRPKDRWSRRIASRSTLRETPSHRQSKRMLPVVETYTYIAGLSYSASTRQRCTRRTSPNGRRKISNAFFARA